MRTRKPGPKKGCPQYRKHLNMPRRLGSDRKANPEYMREYWKRVGRTKPSVSG